MANGNQLPSGFVLDQPSQSALPEGFVLDSNEPSAVDQGEDGGFFGASVIEPALTVASSIPAEIAGGLSTLLPVIMGDPDKAEANLNAMRELITYQPKTEEGKQGLESFGEAMQPVGDVLQTVEDKFSESGAQTFETLGLNPAIGAGVGAAVPEALAMALGLKPAKAIAKTTPAKAAAKAVKELPLDIEDAIKGAGAGTKKLFTEQSQFKKKIAEDITTGGTDKRLAKYIVDGKGRAKKDPFAIEAVKQGFDEGVISAVKGSTPLDRSKMLEMVKIAKKGKENARYAAKNRPSDVVGKSLLERVNYVKRVNKDSGSKLNNVAKSLRGKTVDSSEPIGNFLSSLDEMGVSIGKGLKPNFKGSDIEGLAAPESAIKNIVNRLKSGSRGKIPDAYELHRMKKYIDEVVTFGKAGEGLSGKTEGILKKLRRDLDQTLDSNFTEYDKVNTTYSDTISSLDELQNVAGKKMDLSGVNANKATGTLLRRMLSNAQSRVNLIDSIGSIEKTAKKYGGKFDDDLTTQVLFVDELGSRFGAAAKTSLQGDVEKAANFGKNVRGRTLPDMAIDSAVAVTEKLRGVNEEGAFNAIMKLLDQ